MYENNPKDCPQKLGGLAAYEGVNIVSKPADSPVEGALNQADASLKQLLFTIERLGNRLSTVLSLPPPEEERDASIAGGASPLHARLCRQIDTINAAADRIDSLIGRVTL